MGFGIKRADLKANAKAKLADAILLLENKRFSNAYYLAGYAVELAIKSCISRKFLPDVIPDRAYVDATYKHSLKELIGTAGLTADLNEKIRADATFAMHWSYVARWTETSRYEAIDSYTSQTMIAAITDRTSGVLKWIEQYW